MLKLILIGQFVSPSLSLTSHLHIKCDIWGIFVECPSLIVLIDVFQVDSVENLDLSAVYATFCREGRERNSRALFSDTTSTSRAAAAAATTARARSRA